MIGQPKKLLFKCKDPEAQYCEQVSKGEIPPEDGLEVSFFSDLGLRRGLMFIQEFAPWSYEREMVGLGSKLSRTFATITYGACYGMISRRRKAVEVDVNQLVEKWMEVVPSLALAHDKDEMDKNEARIDELLLPLLTAPKKQVVDFYSLLLTRMKSDKRVPFIIWRSFEVWGDRFLLNAKDEGVVRLKRKLAQEIVDLSSDDLHRDFREALIRALMWRSEDRLEEVKTALVDAKQKGAKPRLRGRQSCLFLEVPKGRGRKPAVIQV